MSSSIKLIYWLALSGSKDLDDANRKVCRTYAEIYNEYRWFAAYFLIDSLPKLKYVVTKYIRKEFDEID